MRSRTPAVCALARADSRAYASVSDKMIGAVFCPPCFRAAARIRFHASWSKPSHCSMACPGRSNPGGRPEAANAASIPRVPDPHIGATTGSPACSPDARTIAAARDSRKGAYAPSRRYPRSVNFRPAASKYTRASSPAQYRSTTTPDRSGPESGRRPMRSTMRSQRASFTSWLAYMELRIMGCLTWPCTLT